MKKINSIVLGFSLIAVSVGLAHAAAPVVVKSHCDMGYCKFMEITSQKEISASSQGRLIEVKARSALIKVPVQNGVPQYEKVKTPNFSEAIKKNWIFCSGTKPAVITPDAAEGFYVDVLSPGNKDSVFVFNTSNYLYYWKVCHDTVLDQAQLTSDEFSQEAKSLGYKKLEADQIGQSQFKTMEQVKQFLNQ